MLKNYIKTLNFPKSLYNLKSDFDIKEKPLRIKRGDRVTFLGQIQSEAKLRPIPGPGGYDITKIDSLEREAS